MVAETGPAMIKYLEQIDIFYIWGGKGHIESWSRVVTEAMLSGIPVVVKDNKDGLSAIVSQLQKINYDQLHFVIGFVNDKNIDDLLNLLPQQAQYYFCKADIPRSLDENKLEELAHKAGLRGKSYGSVREAYNSAVNDSGRNDLVFIGGSTFVVAEVV